MPSSVPVSPVGPIILSVLIPTIPGREPKLARLLRNLDAQVFPRRDVEILVLRDNRVMTIGEKRNKMLSLARGDYVAFVDDDDAVTPDYVGTIVSVLTTDPDVVCFTVTVRGYGPEKPCRYHPDFEHRDLPHEYQRKPNHIMVWRRALATQVQFQSISHGEDTAWAASAAPLAQKVETIPRSLYIYQYDPNDNSSLGARR